MFTELFSFLIFFRNFWSFEKVSSSCFDFWHLQRLIPSMFAKARYTMKNPWKTDLSRFGRRALHMTKKIALFWNQWFSAVTKLIFKLFGVFKRSRAELFIFLIKIIIFCYNGTKINDYLVSKRQNLKNHQKNLKKICTSISI